MAPYPAESIGNYFIKRGIVDNDNLTLMKLNKLIYIAHGMYLAKYNKRLIDEQIQAWKFGPVVKSVYHELRYYGMNKIGSVISGIQLDKEGNLVKKKYDIPKSDKEVLDLLNFVWENYKEYDGPQLSGWTHLPESPWYQAWFTEKGFKEREKIISDESIKEYFLKLARSAGG